MIKKISRRVIDYIFRSYLNHNITLQLDNLSAINKMMQLSLSFKYKQWRQHKMSLPQLEDVGFRVFSQNDEDGVLLYIFSLIGMVNKKAVEICAGDGIECNTANLVINHGWSALLFEGNEQLVKRGREFYASCRDTHIFPPVFVHAWTEAENVNTLITRNGFKGEIDLLSLDMNGIDYWIWKAIDCISPRVVVLEYQDIWGPEKSVTVPYWPDFNRFNIHPDYFGASLPAFVKLGHEKGYRLVGCNRYGFNAFFIRSGVGEDVLPEITLNSCFEHPKVKHGMEKRLPEVMHYEWVEV